MITSTSNARIKRLVNLKKKRKLRDEEGVFLVEGIRMFREVPLDKLKEVYVSESFYKKEKDTVKEVLKDSKIRVEELTDTVFSHASDTKTPQGILCVVEQLNHKISELTSAECPLIMVLDHLQDPGILVTILRTAEGAGVTGILLDRECGDIYNPKTKRITFSKVELGISDDTRYEIVSGCNEGDIVITSVPTGTTLADGDKVKVVTSK